VATNRKVRGHFLFQGLKQTCQGSELVTRMMVITRAYFFSTIDRDFLFSIIAPPL
jgi:hypothetical protein